MSITVNKPIGKTKELFLALCLIGGEISKATVSMLKADYGEHYIRVSVIGYFIRNGCIKRRGTNNDYGYVLTQKGCEYLKIKCPDKYDYEEYSYNHAYTKDANVRLRNRRLTQLLYVLYRSGIDICNRDRNMDKIVNGLDVRVDKPFFVTARSLRQTNEFLRKCFGSRAYGCIVTDTSVFVVYSPDREHNLFLNMEKKLNETLAELMKNAASPYNRVGALKALYLYPTEDDIVDSYTIKIEKLDKNRA